MSNSNSEIYDTYGIGISASYNFEKAKISLRYLYEANETDYIHADYPLTVNPLISIDDQISFSSQTSQIQSHSIGLNFAYMPLAVNVIELSIGPDICYNYFIGNDSFYNSEFNRNRLKLGLQFRIDYFFHQNIGFYNSYTPNYAINFAEKTFDYGLEEPYTQNLFLFDFNLGLTYRF